MAGAKLAEAFVEVQMKLSDSTVRRAQSTVKSAVDKMERDGKIELDVDSNKLDQGLAQTETKVNETVRRLVAGFATIFSARIVGDFFRDAISGAAQLEQAIGGTEAIFGEFASGMSDELRNAATTMGLSEQAARTLTSQIGGLLQGFGFTQEAASSTSLEIAQLGADLAATFGGNPEQAVEALGSALRGEFNPLEQFGISLNQTQINLRAVELGLADSTSEVDLNARAQAALSLIMERSTAAQGQFARESDTAAGKAAILRAEFENQKVVIGQQLLPVYGVALGLLGDLLGVFSELPGPMQTVVVALAGLVAVAGPLSKLTAGISGLSTIIGKLGSAGGPMLGLTAAVGAGVIVYQQFVAEQRRTEENTRKSTDALIDQTPALVTAAEEAGNAAGRLQELAVANEFLSRAIATGNEDLADAAAQLNIGADELLTVLSTLGPSGEFTATTFDNLARSFGLTAEQADFLANNISTDEIHIRQMTADHQEAAEALGITEEQFITLAGAVSDFIDAADETVVQDIARDFLNARVEVFGYEDSLVAAAEAQVGQNRQTGDAVAIYRAWVEILANSTDEQRVLATSTDEVTTATGAAADATESLGRKVQDTDARAKELRPTLSDLADLLSGGTGKAGIAEGAEVAAEKLADVNKAFADTGAALKQLPTDPFAATIEAFSRKKIGIDTSGIEAAANKIKDVGDEADDAAPEVDELANVTGDLTAAFDEADQAADDLARAIDRVIGPGDDLRETTRRVHAELQGLNESLEENGGNFDEVTEAGRDNQEALEAARDAILDHGVALIRNGVSAEEATRDIENNTTSLRNQLLAVIDDEAAVDALIDTYNLTPEDITTALELVGEEEANRTIDRYNALLDTVPESELTEIKAAIDRGDYDEANRLLDNLAATRTAHFVVAISGAQRLADLARRVGGRAEGGYIGRPELSVIGEAGPEVVLPLNRPGRIRELLSDPRVAEPLAGAVGGGDSTVTTYGGVSVGNLTVGTRDDLPAAMDALDALMWRVRVSA